MLDQTASRAAAVQFAAEMRRAGNVPQAYIDDLLQHASQDVRQLQTELSQADDIPQAIRSEASELSGRLAESLRSASEGTRNPDDHALREIETQLRGLAQSVRRGATASDGAAR